MNHSTRVVRRPRRPGIRRARATVVITVMAAALLAAACGSGSSSSATGGSTQHDRALAFARCIRSHGVPNWPDPDSQGGFPGVSKQMLQSAAGQSALDACRHLLNGPPESPQQRRYQAEVALEFARCIRTHGFPDFPDPGHPMPSSIPKGSPQFQSAVHVCSSLAHRKVSGHRPSAGSGS